MNLNYYDLFDHYDAETYGVPDIRTEPIAEEAVMQRVLTKINAAPQKTRRRFQLTKLTAAITAAVLLMASGTITVAANFGGADKFFQSLFASEATISPEKMEPLVTMPGASFDSTNADIQFELLGMYGDQSQTMLSFQITALNETVISSGFSPLVEYSIIRSDGTTETLSYPGQTCSLREDETQEHVYYCNLFITNSDLQGKTLDITFRNFYTDQQIQTIYNTILTMQDEWRNEYIRNTLGEDALNGLEENELPEDFDLEQWKAYWNAQNYDQLTEEKYNELYAASDTALDGTWHTTISLDFPVDEPITASYEYGEIKLQTLSAQISYPEELVSESNSVIFLMTLKDGRKIATDYSVSVFDELYDPQSGEFVLTDDYVNCNSYCNWNEERSVRTEMICYDEPIAPQDIAEIQMLQYKFHWEENAAEEENGWILTNENVIYSAQ